MKSLLLKEIKLAIHPTVIIFWLLSAMLLIPSYPLLVVFFYTTLGLFFVCLTGRENHDIEYTMTLPVRKRDVVRARLMLAMGIELAQFVIAVPFAVLRQTLGIQQNDVGINANITLFSFGLLCFAAFNYIFFTGYYRKPDKVGGAFVKSSIAMFVVLLVLEASTHIVPFVRDQLDTPDPQFIALKLIVLAGSLTVYALATYAAYRRSARSFEALDL